MRATHTLLAAAISAILLLAPAASQPQLTTPPSAGPQKPLLPSSIAILAMVRSTLIAVDQGNKTGNYTVLRDLASPQFRETNDALKLAKIFSMLANQNIDLLAVTVAEPQYKTPPEITPQNMLHVYGTFAIAPRAVNFEMLYEMYGGRWRLFGILLEPAKETAATSPSPPAQPSQQ